MLSLRRVETQPIEFAAIDAIQHLDALRCKRYPKPRLQTKKESCIRPQASTASRHADILSSNAKRHTAGPHAIGSTNAPSRNADRRPIVCMRCNQGRTGKRNYSTKSQCNAHTYHALTSNITNMLICSQQKRTHGPIKCARRGLPRPPLNSIVSLHSLLLERRSRAPLLNYRLCLSSVPQLVVSCGAIRLRMEPDRPSSCLAEFNTDGRALNAPSSPPGVTTAQSTAPGTTCQAENGMKQGAFTRQTKLKSSRRRRRRRFAAAAAAVARRRRICNRHTFMPKDRGAPHRRGAEESGPGAAPSPESQCVRQ